MSRILKWSAFIVAGFIVLIVLAVLIAPLVFNLEKLKPQIESQVSERTGRPFRLGGELKPSVFPWVGMSLSDLELGNTKDFKDPTFIAVDHFEVRLKLLPILTGKYEFKKFVVDGARVMLIKNKDGRLNTESLVKTTEPSEKSKLPAAQPAAEASKSSLPIKNLQVAEFAVVNSSVTWLDQTTGTRKDIKDINLRLKDVSFDKPVGVDFSALADAKQIAVRGTLGPLGDQPGKSPVPLDLLVQVVKKLDITFSGRIDPTGEIPRFELDVAAAPFDVRALLAELQMPLGLETADPQVLKKIALNLKLSGSPQSVALSNGKLILDDSTLTFSGKAKDFSKPDVDLTAALDKIDIDRYLPPAAEKPAETKQPEAGPAKKGKPDYKPLRKLVMNARVTVGDLTVKKAHMQSIEVRIKARNGIIHVDPFNMSLYKGTITANSTLDVRGEDPKSDVSVNLSSVQAGPLLKDLLDKEPINGALTAAIDLTFSGDQPDLIRKTLGGKGALTFNDGAIIGIDLADMVRNVEAAFGAGQKPAEKPRTDFSELLVPFSISKGLAKIDGSKLQSPLLRVLADGSADLVEEKLNIRVVPKFVATLVGQGDTENRSGFMVPVLVGGNFTKPKFSPDLKGLLGQDLPGKQNLTKEIEKKKETVTEDIQKKAQELFKGLPFGNTKQE